MFDVCLLVYFACLWYSRTIVASVANREEGGVLEEHERGVFVGYLEEDQGHIANQGKPPSCSCPLSYYF